MNLTHCRSEQTAASRVCDGLQPRVNTELAEDVLHMVPDRRAAHPQPRRRGCGAEPFSYQPKHLQLSRRQPFGALRRMIDVLAQVTQQMLGPRGVVKDVDDERRKLVPVRRKRHHLEPNISAAFGVRQDAEGRAHALQDASGRVTAGAADPTPALSESREDFCTAASAHLSRTEAEGRLGGTIPEHDAPIGSGYPRAVFGAREARAQRFRQCAGAVRKSTVSVRHRRVSRGPKCEEYTKRKCVFLLPLRRASRLAGGPTTPQ